MPFFFNQSLVVTSPNGTVTFNSDGVTGDIDAEIALIDHLDGWTKTAPPVVVQLQRAIGDGAIVARRFYTQARTLAIEGIVATTDETETENAWNDLVYNAFPLNEDITITAYGPRPKYVTCRVASAIEPVQFMPDGFRFSLEAICADPFKYDAVETLTGTSGIVGTSSGGFTFPLEFPIVFNGTAAGAGSQVILNNIGTADTLPTFTISGQLDSGWRLENDTGETLSFDVSMLAGQTMTIDSKLETAFVNGSPVTGLVDGDWFALHPGVNVIKLFGNYYSGTTFTVTAKSAWR